MGPTNRMSSTDGENNGHIVESEKEFVEFFLKNLAKIVIFKSLRGDQS